MYTYLIYPLLLQNTYVKLVVQMLDFLEVSSTHNSLVIDQVGGFEVGNETIQHVTDLLLILNSLHVIERV
jgi:hypothetical protein